MSRAARPYRCVAVDLGAASGRVVLGTLHDGGVACTELHRFANVPVRVNGTLRWDIRGLFREVLAGLRDAAGDGEPIVSVGVDSWAVDYGLLDESDELISDPIHYRDSRTDDVMAAVHRDLGVRRLYSWTGVQMQPFNTLYQLKAAEASGELARARSLLLIPDLIGYWLTGRRVAEETNASTTQMFDVTTARWSKSLRDYLHLPESFLPDLVAPGTDLGPLTADVRGSSQMPAATSLVSVCSHDTASAIVALPTVSDDFAYISCGTWSLVGLELRAPVLTDDARVSNFTNERGLDGTIRFLRNVAGLWLLQECLRTWRERGADVDLNDLIRAASRDEGYRRLIDPDDPSFRPQGDMPSRIRAYCLATGQRPPSTEAEVTRCILDSLSLAHAYALDMAMGLTDSDVETVHLVGGGARNELLCQLTADVSGIRVEAGPVEASALGNVLVQMRASGHLPPDLGDLRRLARSTTPVRPYEPHADRRVVADARRRFADLRAVAN